MAVVATADVIFIHRCPLEGKKRLLEYDDAMRRHGVPNAAHKDEELAHEDEELQREN